MKLKNKLNKKQSFYKALLCSMIIAMLILNSGCTKAYAAVKNGDSGDEVKQIQTKLKNWGYYDGSVDGSFGKSTMAAVKAFQKKQGIKVDGIVGTETANKMGIQLKGGGKSRDDKGDVYLIARVVYGEARGEPYKGKVAVASVVLNRVGSSLFPNSISKVVYQKNAFSIVADGQINYTPDQDALKAARDAMNGWDPSGGAIFYYNPDKTKNEYIRSRKVITVIGSHRFCK
jgi:N-acetylmuramoyl-L-alanine amidase